MKKIKDFFAFIILIGVIIVYFGLIIYGIFFYPKDRTQDILDHYYISTYQVHYVDGATDTAYVVGPYSDTQTVEYNTTTNYDEGTGYVFCGVQGICRTRLLHYKKTYPKFSEVSDTNITFKHNF